MKQVRIVNEGNASYQTKITDAETGEALTNVRRVEITLDVAEHPQAILYTVLPAVDVTIEATEKKICPCCGREMDENEQAEKPTQAN